MKRVWFVGVSILLCVVILFTYKDIPGVFYLNDEWRMLANVYIHGLSATWYKETITDFSLFHLLLGKTRVLSTIINNLILLKYPLNVTPFIVLFYVLHIINSVIVYLLAYKFSKQHSVAIITALFFAITVRHSQSLIWIGAGVQILISGVLSFICLLLFYRYVAKKEMISLVLAAFLGYVSFLIRPNAIFLYPFLIGGSVFIVNRKKFIHWLKKYLWFIVIGIPSVMAMAYKLFVHGFPTVAMPFWETIKIGTANSFYYPFISLGHYLIHPDLLIRLSKWYMSFQYPGLQNDSNTHYLIYFIFSDLITQPISLIFVVAIVYVWKKWKAMRSAIEVMGLWYFCAFFPVNFFLLQRYSSYIESRYVYYQSITVGFFVALVFVYVYKNARTWLPKYSNATRIALVLLVLLFIAKQIQITQREVNVWVGYSREMTAFIQEWKSAKLSIPKKPIFYIVSDRGFMNPGTRLPFMLGDGFVLSILLYPSGVIPSSNMGDQYLSAYGSQGYRESGGKGYGYFYDMKSLVQTFESNPSLSPNQLIAFYYHGFEHRIEDITEEIRSQLDLRLRGMVSSTYE